MADSASHTTELCQGLWGLRDHDRYTDFVVVSADKKEFSCHRVVLAAVSPFFDTLFNSEMMESQSGRVDLPFESETVELVLKYIYTGAKDFTEETIPALYYAANYLQIRTLRQDCEAFLSKGTGHEISLEIWQIAKSFGNQQVAEVAKSIVLQNFNAFCHVESIGRISLDDLKLLLQDKSVNCSGSVKCTAAWIWLIAKESADVAIAKELVSALVASENVDNEDILTVCGNDGDKLVEMVGMENIGKIDESRALWEKACAELWIQRETNTWRRNPSHSLSECLIILGGTPSNDNKLTVFNFKKKLWYSLPAQPRDLGHRYAICSLGSYLYLSGGTLSPTGFLCFDADRGIWGEQEPLPVGREQHNMCTVPENSIKIDQRVERKIYILAGRSQHEPNLRDVHVYSVGDMKWSRFGEVAYPVTAACCTVVDRRIYLIGGSEPQISVRSGTSPASDMIQCFDTENGTSWKIDLKLPFKAKALKMGVICLEGDKIAHQVFLLYDQKLYKLFLGKRSHNASIEMVAEVPGAPLKGFAVTAFGERVFIFGGEDDNFRIVRSVLQYDAGSQQIVTLPIQTPDKLKDFFYTFILVPNSWILTELSNTSDGKA